MAFLAIFEFLVVLLILAFVVTQVLLPLWNGTKLFWYFRKDSALNRLATEQEKFAEENLARKADTWSAINHKPNE